MLRFASTRRADRLFNITQSVRRRHLYTTMIPSRTARDAPLVPARNILQNHPARSK
jgi:hypothetical protein